MSVIRFDISINYNLARNCKILVTRKGVLCSFLASINASANFL